MTHPLTDDIIWGMWSEGDRSALAEEKLARAAADWQLEQVIEWLSENRYIIGSARSIELRIRLMEAMRPQEDTP